MFPAIYKMDAYSFKCTGIFTTKMPTDAYRGAGRPEATFAIERIMDELAAELALDPLELRERNWIKHEEFPYTTIAGLTYDSGNYEAATARAKELFGYDGLRKEQELRRANNDPVQLGIGISTFTEMCGLAPSRVLGSLAYGAGGWEQASIRMLPTGKVEVVTGSSAHGQGHETAWSQIVADQLGVPFEDIRVLHGDTQISPKGMDTYGSRSLAVGGMALVSASDKVVEKAKVIAAGWSRHRPMTWSGRRAGSPSGDPDKGLAIAEIALLYLKSLLETGHVLPGRRGRCTPNCAPPRWPGTIPVRDPKVTIATKSNLQFTDATIDCARRADCDGYSGPNVPRRR